MKKKIALVLSLVLLVVCTVSATLAYLNDKSEDVKNTFTVGNINIVLAETPAGGSALVEGQDNVYQMIPGTEYRKDPTVTVKGGSEECYLFVKFDDTNASDYINYKSNLNTTKGWIQGDGTDIPKNVWYRVVAKQATDTVFELLDGNTITIKDTVTNQNMNDAAAVQLVYSAYAVQKANIDTPKKAWTEALMAEAYTG